MLDKDDREKAVIQCDKLINKFLLRGKAFVEYACFQYGQFNYIMGEKPDARFIDDFQYFVFTKSTKTLESIRTLLDLGHMEDVLVLLRTMLEGYLASRFINEEYDDELLNDFIFVPRLISHRKVIYEHGEAKNRESRELVDFIQRNPSQLKLGKDKAYFSDFYDYLCNYAHCNFSILQCYLDENNMFTCEKETNAYMVRVLVLFVYLKIFESIVTVQGEDFIDARTEQECYKLVIDVTKFVYEQLEFFIKYECKDVNVELNRHMQKMFKNMKKSLKEELGSVKKDFVN